MNKLKSCFIVSLAVGLFAVVPYSGVEASAIKDRSVGNSHNSDNYLAVRGRSGARVRSNPARANVRRDRLDRNNAPRERRENRLERRRAVERGRR